MWCIISTQPQGFESLASVKMKIFAKLNDQKKPTLIVAKTIIGKGSPNKAGTHKVHGAPLGPEEVIATKKALGFPEEAFYVPKSVEAFFQNKLKQ